MPLVSPYLETTNINVNELKSLIKSHIEWLDRLNKKRKKKQYAAYKRRETTSILMTYIGSK